jgi:hypothetical protein
MLAGLVIASMAGASAAIASSATSVKQDSGEQAHTETEKKSESMWPLYALMAIEAALFVAPVAAMMLMAYKLLPIVLR